MSKDKEDTAEVERDVAVLLQDRANLTLKKCRRYMEEATAEYKYLRDDDSGQSKARRYELARALGSGSKYLGSQEPIVDVDIPKTSAGLAFRINETIYHEGTHRVPASVAQVLLFMIQSDRVNEGNLLKQNGRAFDLGDVGQKARHVEMQR